MFPQFCFTIKILFHIILTVNLDERMDSLSGNFMERTQAMLPTQQSNFSGLFACDVDETSIEQFSRIKIKPEILKFSILSLSWPQLSKI